MLRWVVDSVAVVESGDEAFIDEFFGLLSCPFCASDPRWWRAPSPGSARRGPTGRSVASTARRRARTWRPAASSDGPRADRCRRRARRGVPFAEKLCVLVLDPCAWFCDYLRVDGVSKILSQAKEGACPPS